MVWRKFRNPPGAWVFKFDLLPWSLRKSTPSYLKRGIFVSTADPMKVERLRDFGSLVYVVFRLWLGNRSLLGSVLDVNVILSHSINTPVGPIKYFVLLLIFEIEFTSDTIHVCIRKSRPVNYHWNLCTIIYLIRFNLATLRVSGSFVKRLSLKKCIWPDSFSSTLNVQI